MYQMLLGVMGGAFGGILTTILAFYKTSILDSEKVVADYNAVKVLKNLLSLKKYPYRSFALLSHFVGGYADDDLRKLLVRAGAIRGMSADGREAWALWSRVLKYPQFRNNLPWQMVDKLDAPADELLFPAKLESRGAVSK